MWFVDKGWFGWFAGEYEQLKFQFPQLLNGCWGFALLIPLYLRNFIQFRKLSIYHCISFGLNWWLFAVIAQLIFGRAGSWEYNTINTLFIGTLFLTWIGMRSVAGFGWLVVFILAIVNLLNADYSLRYFGFFFLVCAFSSLMFQTNLSPGDLFRNFVTEFRGMGQGRIEYVRASMENSARKTGETVKFGTRIAKKAIAS